MTIYGWDASNWDSPPTARDGIDFYTHKAAEGHRFYRDIEYKSSLDNARALGVPVLGAYFVTHPGTVSDQVDWFLSIVNTDTPWWRQYPWIWQIDAEKFSYMDRAPNLDEINGFGDLICNRALVPASSVIAYAPRWLYGDSLRGLRYRLWASNYGDNPTTHYRSAYPGDGSSRWAPYSAPNGPADAPDEPIFLQYGSRLTIGNQTTCDANAFRGDLNLLLATLGGDMLTPDQERVLRNAEKYLWRGAYMQDFYEIEYPVGTIVKPPIPNVWAQTLRSIVTKLDALTADAAVRDAREVARDAGQDELIRGIAAAAGVTLSDAQVAALAERAAAAVSTAVGEVRDRVLAELARQEAEREAGLRAALAAETAAE